MQAGVHQLYSMCMQSLSGYTISLRGSWSKQSQCLPTYLGYERVKALVYITLSWWMVTFDSGKYLHQMNMCMEFAA
jgi:hypothetical protein